MFSYLNDSKVSRRRLSSKPNRKNQHNGQTSLHKYSRQSLLQTHSANQQSIYTNKKQTGVCKLFPNNQFVSSDAAYVLFAYFQQISQYREIKRKKKKKKFNQNYSCQYVYICENVVLRQKLHQLHRTESVHQQLAVIYSNFKC